jgi:hypothetical protein
MLNWSTGRVKLLAAAIWYGGGLVLLWKAWELNQRALILASGEIFPWVALIIGVIIGIIKARYLFSQICRKNLHRIESLTKPKLGQCYHWRFFIFLFFMIILGILMSAWAQDRYVMLLCVAILDLSIGVALLGSSYVFWTHESSIPDNVSDR